MNENFKEIYTSDDMWLSLRIEWDSNEDYYITYRECEDVSDLLIHSIECKFYGFTPTGNAIIFVDSYGVKHEINPINEHTRDSIRIYRIIGDLMTQPVGSVPEKEIWFEVATIPFDRNFFKLGHCYMVRENLHGDLSPMMLIGMDTDEMHFVRVNDPDRFKDPGIKHVYVKAEKYKKVKKTHWFKALMEGDAWSNDDNKEISKTKEE